MVRRFGWGSLVAVCLISAPLAARGQSTDPPSADAGAAANHDTNDARVLATTAGDAGTGSIAVSDASATSVVGESTDASAAPIAPGASAAPPASEQQLVVHSDSPYTAASSQTVRDTDLSLRPISRPGDVLEVAPGLIILQHAGGGHANQYLVRGFDADHGTDLSINVDDVPVNLPTHAHGQGYADPHILIPELIERIEVREGPYFAQDGDFATAGAINLRLRERVASSSVTLEGGLNVVTGPDNARFLGILQTDVGPVHGYLGLEIAHIDGAFVHPTNYDHYNVIGHWAMALGAHADVTLAVMSYAGDWHGSGQIPATLIGQQLPYPGGTFTQWDSIDPSEGGQSQRHQAALTFRARPTPHDDFTLLLYAFTYSAAIFSDFTFFLVDPVHGDEIEQDDSRIVTGLRATWRDRQTVGSWRFLTTVGTTLRYDDIDNALHHDEQRQRLSDLVVDHVNELGVGVFAEEQVIPNSRVRLVLGAREDAISFDVADERTGLPAPDPTRNGSTIAAQFSPKASLVLTPLRTTNVNWDVYLNFGRGFHSNDGRGTIVPATPSLSAACSNAQTVPVGVNCPVTPITSALGGEVGTRMRLFNRVDLSVSGWLLYLDQETVWDGDTGTTELSGPTRRLGVTFEGRARILDWFFADVDVTFVNAVYTDLPSGMNAVPIAPWYTVNAGLSARHPIGLYGALRVRSISDRPGDPQSQYTLQGWTIFTAQLGYHTRRFDVGVHVDNLFNASWREAQYEETYALQGGPATTGVKFSPGAPFTATARFTLYLP